MEEFDSNDSDRRRLKADSNSDKEKEENGLDVREALISVTVQ